MSPAPGRDLRGSSERFPQAWGYWFGPTIILLGVVIAAVMIVGGIQGLVDDVNDFRRVVGGADSLEGGLQAGTEYFVYDEDGFNTGPFDITVVRASDGTEVATRQVFDGASYDVDGRKGEARVAFNVPTSDIYRIELDTSVGQVARFAVGADVGNDRTTSIVRGVIIGAVFGLIGFAVLIWTMVMHARWKLQDAVLSNVSTARRTLRRRTETSPSTEDLVDDASSAASSWTRDALTAVKERLPAGASDTDDGRPPTWRQSLADQARDQIENVEAQLETLEPIATEALSDVVSEADVSAELADRIDEALGRIQDRVGAGDSLRDIARDERDSAVDVARDLGERAQEAATRLPSTLAPPPVSPPSSLAPPPLPPSPLIPEVSGGLVEEPVPERVVADNTVVEDTVPEPVVEEEAVVVEQAPPKPIQEQSAPAPGAFAGLAPPPSAAAGISGQHSETDHRPASASPVEQAESDDDAPESAPVESAGRFTLAPAPRYDAFKLD